RLAETLAGSRTWPQPRLVLGVTGAPGSGKSTLVDRLAAEYRRRRPERRLGIVAVDPSSPFTGGAILGDRVRMMRHATDPGVFIRSLASRGRLGGLALGARGIVRVMGLIGCDVVIVETVGVGQSEVEIAQNADATIVVLAPGQGDSIQLLKAGLIEAGSMFVVNKADRHDAIRLHQQLLAALQLGRHIQAGVEHAAHHGIPKLAPQQVEQIEPILPPDRPVFLCSATNNVGVDAIVDHLDLLSNRCGSTWLSRRKEQTIDELREAVVHEAGRRVSAVLDQPDVGAARLRELLDGGTPLSDVVDDLMQQSLASRDRPPETPVASPPLLEASPDLTTAARQGTL
ncbi:MAG TPA: hypothetical protein PJ982_15900, partial [Lacipirellulaceae bacterium]|nr:hypothetical protein [Lacipirellulaceae bacterium]